MRQIFTERLPTVVAPYVRRTARLTDVFTLIGFALGGEAGKRLVAGMGLTASPDTLLRLIRTQEEPPVQTPRVLGVDDFSFCKRKTYGNLYRCAYILTTSTMYQFGWKIIVMESGKRAFLQRAKQETPTHWRPGVPRREHAHDVEPQAASA